MKIYVFEVECRYNCESYKDLKVFISEDKAKEYLKIVTSEFRKDVDGWFIEEDSSTCFSAYKEGDECCNHYFFKIHEIHSFR